MKPESADYLAKARECLDAAKADPRVDRKLASLSGRAYKYKETADYGVGSQSVVTVKEAQDVIAIAQRFVDTMTQLLPPGITPQR